MDKKYTHLFALIAHSTANIAEQVMDLHKENNDDDRQYNAAVTMRDDFLNLYEKLNSEESLTKVDYARLLVGSIIVANQIDSRIKTDKTALRGYKTDIIPKLDQINQADDEESALRLAEELFQVKEEEEEENSEN